MPARSMKRSAIAAACAGRFFCIVVVCRCVKSVCRQFAICPVDYLRLSVKAVSVEFERTGLSESVVCEKNMSKKQLSIAQQAVVWKLRDGIRLWWFGDNGPEFNGIPFWPQKKTVRILLEKGVLRWKPYANESQKQCGHRELELVPENQVPD